MDLSPFSVQNDSIRSSRPHATADTIAGMSETPKHELKAISAAIVALVGAVLLAAVLASTPSFPLACTGAFAILLILVGLAAWIWQITRT